MSDLFPAPGEGDFILVDTSAYGLPGDRWCRVSWVLPPGAASSYRVNAAVPGYGMGLFTAAQIAGWRAAGRGEPGLPAEVAAAYEAFWRRGKPGPRFAGLMAAAAAAPGLPAEVAAYVDPPGEDAFTDYWRRGEPR